VFVLTDKGRRIYDEVGPDSELLYADIEKKFGADKLETLYALLSEFYTALANTDAA
jgi:DNA-binding MarR family transcriptional regulator